MTTPARILRRLAQDRDPWPRFLTERQIACRDRILALGQYLMAEKGRQNITFSNLATALRIGRDTLRFHFCDLDALLGDIIRAHLLKLAAAMGNIPDDAPDRQQARRAAYLAYTRRPFGGLTEAHLLYVRDRHLLPPDELESIELMRLGMGDLLAGELAEEALLLLDAPTLDTARIEARLTTPKRIPQNLLSRAGGRGRGRARKGWEGEGARQTNPARRPTRQATAAGAHPLPAPLEKPPPRRPALPHRETRRLDLHLRPTRRHETATPPTLRTVSTQGRTNHLVHRAAPPEGVNVVCNAPWQCTDCAGSGA